MNIIKIYLIIINIISLTIMGYDKIQAILKKRRIPEITLLSLIPIGGSIGTILGIIIFKHKIKKKKFIILSILLSLLSIYIYKLI